MMLVNFIAVVLIIVIRVVIERAKENVRAAGRRVDLKSEEDMRRNKKGGGRQRLFVKRT